MMIIKFVPLLLLRIVDPSGADFVVSLVSDPLKANKTLVVKGLMFYLIN